MAESIHISRTGHHKAATTTAEAASFPCAALIISARGVRACSFGCYPIYMGLPREALSVWALAGRLLLSLHPWPLTLLGWVLVDGQGPEIRKHVLSHRGYLSPPSPALVLIGLPNQETMSTAGQRTGRNGMLLRRVISRPKR